MKTTKKSEPKEILRKVIRNNTDSQQRLFKIFGVWGNKKSCS